SFDSPTGFYFLPHSCLSTTDLDGDGILDLVVTDDSQTSLKVVKGLGDGTFARNPSTGGLAILTTPVPAGAKLTALADLNGDGKLDVAVTGTDKVSVLIGNGDGSFQTPTSFAAPGAYDVIAANYDRDGRPDLVVSNIGNTNEGLNQDRGNLYML